MCARQVLYHRATPPHPVFIPLLIKVTHFIVKDTHGSRYKNTFPSLNRIEVKMWANQLPVRSSDHYLIKLVSKYRSDLSVAVFI